MHGDDLRVLVRHLDTDRTLARHRGDDTDTQSREVQGDIILQVLDLRDTHARVGDHLIQRDGRADRRLDRGDADTKALQRLLDTFLVRVLLVHIDLALINIVFLQKVDRRVLERGEIQFRIVIALGRLVIVFLIANRHLNDQPVLVYLLGHVFFLFGDCHLKILVRSFPLLLNLRLVYLVNRVRPALLRQLRLGFLQLGLRVEQPFLLIRRPELAGFLLDRLLYLVGLFPRLTLKALQPAKREKTLQERDGLGTHEHGDHHERAQQHQDRSRNPDIRHQHFRDIIAMLPAQIDKGILIAMDKDEGEEYRSPNQDSGARQEPFDQRDPAQPHQLRAHRSQEKEQGERRQAKQAVHQQVRQESAPHARPVLNSATVYQQVAQGNILHQALIRRSRKEKRDQRQSDINRHHDQYQARDKAGSLIRQKGLNGLKQALAVPFRRRICFLNHNGFSRLTVHSCKPT